jgi:hypothetical protein
MDQLNINKLILKKNKNQTITLKCLIKIFNQPKINLKQPKINLKQQKIPIELIQFIYDYLGCYTNGLTKILKCIDRFIDDGHYLYTTVSSNTPDSMNKFDLIKQNPQFESTGQLLVFNYCNFPTEIIIQIETCRICGNYVSIKNINYFKKVPQKILCHCSNINLKPYNGTLIHSYKEYPHLVNYNTFGKYYDSITIV